MARVARSALARLASLNLDPSLLADAGDGLVCTTLGLPGERERHRRQDGQSRCVVTFQLSSLQPRGARHQARVVAGAPVGIAGLPPAAQPNSLDSRHFGPLPASQIVGAATPLWLFGGAVRAR